MRSKEINFQSNAEHFFRDRGRRMYNIVLSQ